MKAYLEHINITVSNVDNSLKFFGIAFPEFKIRGGGSGEERTWVHFGTDESYLAINNEVRPAACDDQSYDTLGINHAGFVVTDVTSLGERLEAAGYRRSYARQEQPTRIREYFEDADGNEFEFVEYLTADTAARNTYDD